MSIRYGFPINNKYPKYPEICEDDILLFLEDAKFIKIDCSLIRESILYNQMEKIYNYQPIILRYSCDNPTKFSRCIYWFGKGDGTFNNWTQLSNKLVKTIIINKSLSPISAGLAELTEGWDIDWGRFEKVSFDGISPFQFDGVLAELVFHGGILTKWDSSDSDAKNWAKSFVDLIIQDRFTEFKIYEVDQGWSGWFSNMGYDMSYFIFDEGKGEFWILAKTDGT
jgi:hypothetical protein